MQEYKRALVELRRCGNLVIYCGLSLVRPPDEERVGSAAVTNWKRDD